MCQGDSTQPVSDAFWRVGDNIDSVRGSGAEIYRPDVFEIIERTVQGLDGELRELSLDIHGASCHRLGLQHSEVEAAVDHPELKFEEQYVSTPRCGGGDLADRAAATPTTSSPPSWRSRGGRSSGTTSSRPHGPRRSRTAAAGARSA